MKFKGNFASIPALESPLRKILDKIPKTSKICNDIIKVTAIFEIEIVRSKFSLSGLY